MRWFNSRQKKMALLQSLKPTSKATLKMHCLIICRADIDEASRLYDFFAKDMPELPDYDPVPPTWMDSTKDIANGIVGWLGKNKDNILQGYEFIRNMTGNRLPPLTLPMEQPPAEPIPDINA